MKGRIVFLAKLIISLGLFVALFVFNRIEMDRVSSAILGANLYLLLLAFVLYLLAIAAGCLKWQILAKAQGIRAPYFSLLSFTFVGLFFGNFMPTNVGGDVIRAYDLSRLTDNPAEASISVFVDRLLGLLVFIGSAAGMAVVALIMVGNRAIEEIALASAVVFFSGLVFFVALLSRRISGKGSLLFTLVPQLAPLRETAKRLQGALHAYRHAYRALAFAALISLFVQVVTTAVNYLISESLGLGIPFLYFFLFNPLIAFVLLVPISINGIGLKQTAYVFFYSTLTGLALPEKSLSLSLIMHTVIIVSGALGGIFWLQRRSLRPTVTALRDLPVEERALG